MSWKAWLEDGRIETHRPVRAEIDGHRQAAERSLADAALQGISPEGRFQLAYNAALGLATLAVVASGYRIKSRVGHHQITFEAAGVALGEEASVLIKYFDRCRRTRNVITYEGDEISTEQANELLRECKRFAALVGAWLAKHRAELA